jgi:hypothetical protein
MMTSALETASAPSEIEFCLYINRDDSTYDGRLNEYPKNQIKILRGPRMWLSSMYNSLLSVATGEYFFWSGDDVVFRTQDWDLQLKKPFEFHSDKLCVAHVNDGANYSQIWATIGMVHIEWVNLFGYVFTPQIPDNGIDAWITYVANFAQRRYYLKNVLIEHIQYRQGKSSIDPTYTKRTIEHQKYNPLMLYKTLSEYKQLDSLILMSAINKNLFTISKDFIFSNIFVKFLKTVKKESISTNKELFFLSMRNKTFLKYILYKLRLPTIPKKWF